MERINECSRATFLFDLEWQHGTSVHRDQLWTDQVNMWRDILPAELAETLIEKKEGDIATIEIAGHSFFESTPGGRVVQLSPSRFHGPEGRDKIEAVPGRFYPQGFLHGVDGAFIGSTAPARCISREDNMLHFDLSHPLACHDLALSAEIKAIHSSKVERGGRCEDWLEQVSANGPGMQARYKALATDFFAVGGMRPGDSSADHLFYSSPRLVQHLDSTARETIGQQYAQLIEPGSRVLDLMASWDSHLPDDLDLHSLTALGMNQVELDANRRATDSVIQDLNRNPLLPFADNSFDTIICTASIEYLTGPLSVFAEMHRVLVPKGVLAVAFSNRWFPPKAVKIWGELHEFERLGMVMEMFYRTSGLTNLHTLTRRGEPRPIDDPHQEIVHSDPVFMAWGTKGTH